MVIPLISYETWECAPLTVKTNELVSYVLGT